MQQQVVENFLGVQIQASSRSKLVQAKNLDSIQSAVSEVSMKQQVKIILNKYGIIILEGRGEISKLQVAVVSWDCQTVLLH